MAEKRARRAERRTAVEPLIAGPTAELTRYVALLRAVNVAGRSRVLMSELRKIFESAGAANPRTYIQSGNVAFEARSRDKDAILSKASHLLGTVLGGRPVMVVRSAEQLTHLVALSPFEPYRPDPIVKLYVAFLAEEPERIPDLPLLDEKERLEAIGIRDHDVFVVSRRKANGFFGFPNAFVENAFGRTATSRNWSTVLRLASLG